MNLTKLYLEFFQRVRFCIPTMSRDLFDPNIHSYRVHRDERFPTFNLIRSQLLAMRFKI